MHTGGTVSNRPAHSSEEVSRDDLLVQQGQGIIGMLVQIASSQARLEQRVDGVSNDVTDVKTTVATLSDDVKDLTQWKNRLWGMAILLGGLAAGSGGIWAIVDRHIAWTTDTAASEASNAPLSAR
ncbi:MAG TPA: hypothetical protein VM621_00725 [Luteibacter sp.]|uniref:hypothetical protein n=1 Tax=Luteibacter sp. TaxID=1886636 RepID=UPI002BF9E205|nr:hypothetical protein [Luteibacter sp.]HVI53557.1 hypothetical protein [Luteibacter sp.]